MTPHYTTHCSVNTLHYTTVHYTTLYYTTLHYTTLTHCAVIATNLQSQQKAQCPDPGKDTGTTLGGALNTAGNTYWARGFRYFHTKAKLRITTGIAIGSSIKAQTRLRSCGDVSFCSRWRRGYTQYTLARDNLAQEGKNLCPWLDYLILAHTDTFGCQKTWSITFCPCAIFKM